MAEQTGVDYLVFANIQYRNWALLNREELLPTREQIAHAESAVQAARARRRTIWCSISRRRQPPPLRLEGPRAVLQRLLARARDESRALAATAGYDVPLLVKWQVVPGDARAVRLAQQLRVLGYDGMVAAFDSGNLSRACWMADAPRAIGHLVDTIGPQLALIGVGGIDCVERAVALRHAGVRLVQIYRRFVTSGSGLVRAIATAQPAHRARLPVTAR